MPTPSRGSKMRRWAGVENSAPRAGIGLPSPLTQPADLRARTPPQDRWLSTVQSLHSSRLWNPQEGRWR